MRIVIDAASKAAASDQVRKQIVELVRSGQLIAETKLPAVRQLAADLRLAPNTVAKAYRELEAAGVLVTRGRLGTFVAPGDDPVRSRAELETTRYVQQMRELGLSAADIAALVDTALRAR
jgi:DNA-binding transcriptional regulator YhcF (GntR family)